MTRYRVAFSGFTILAVAVSAAMDANAQAKASGRARMLNSSGSVVASCDTYSLTSASDGSLEVTCSTTSGTPTPTPTPTPVTTKPDAPTLVAPISGTSLLTNTPTYQWTASAGAASYWVLVQNLAGVGVNMSVSAAAANCGSGTGTCSYQAPNVLSAGNWGWFVNATNSFGTSAWSNSGQFNVQAGATPSASPTPTPTPTVTPSPTPSPTPTVGGATCTNSAGQTMTTPANIVMQNMYIGGTNNYAFDSLAFSNPPPGVQFNGDAKASSPQDTIQVYPLPQTWPDQTPVVSAIVNFASYIYYNLSGAQYEVGFSKCKGDFTYYKTQAATVNYYGTPYQPCGIVWGADFNAGWGVQGDYVHCQVPSNEQWYMNWRVVPGTCPTNQGKTCGQTFFVPKG